MPKKSEKSTFSEEILKRISKLCVGLPTLKNEVFDLSDFLGINFEIGQMEFMKPQYFLSRLVKNLASLPGNST